MQKGFGRKFLGKILVWATLMLGATLAQGMVTDVGAVVHFSRACKFLGINESGTWNFVKPLNDFYYVVSAHINYDYNIRNWDYKTLHWVHSGWNKYNLQIDNGTSFPYLTANGQKSAQRSLAQHTNEFLSTPGVVGFHHIWDFRIKWYRHVHTSFTMSCPDFS